LNGGRLDRRSILLLAEERLRSAEELERVLAGEGAVPDTGRLLLRRYGPHLRFAGGVLIGISVAFFSMLMNFIVLNRFIHISF
jgi:hypothetical protein